MSIPIAFSGARGVTRGAIGGFLGTFTSRYSDHGGYWLMGFLAADFQPRSIDLCVAGAGASGVTASMARRRFREQVDKSPLDWARIQAATLLIEDGGPAQRWRRAGMILVFRVRVVLVDGRTCVGVARVFAAPHDPRLERRRAQISLSSVPSGV